MEMPETYNLAYTSTAPALEAHDVKHRETRTFFDREFTFAVIGDSHYIGCGNLGYHELLTCGQINGNNTATNTEEQGFRDRDGLTKTVPLTVGHAETLRHVVSGVGVETEIAGEPLSEFGSPDTFDISYRFDDDAHTAIRLLADDTYMTYHTYPECDLALRTETSLVTLQPSDADQE